MKKFFRYLVVLVLLPFLFMNLECNDEDMPTYVEPIADFTASKTVVSVGEVITFTDKSNDPNGDILNWSWRFGDDTRSSLQNPTHSYSSAGIYEVELIVFDDHSQSGSKTMEITVN